MRCMRESPKLFVGWVGQLIDEEGGRDSALCIYVQFHLQQILFERADQVDDKFDYEVLVILLQQLTGHQ